MSNSKKTKRSGLVAGFGLDSFLVILISVIWFLFVHPRCLPSLDPWADRAVMFIWLTDGKSVGRESSDDGTHIAPFYFGVCDLQQCNKLAVRR
jgi:hypothetical protein